MSFNFYSFVFFFFQAEDGIRYRTVTGVQTCALPIFSRRGRRAAKQHSPRQVCDASVQLAIDEVPQRSEERRVGKECRSRGGGGECKEEGSGEGERRDGGARQANGQSTSLLSASAIPL